MRDIITTIEINTRTPSFVKPVSGASRNLLS